MVDAVPGRRVGRKPAFAAIAVAPRISRRAAIAIGRDRALGKAGDPRIDVGDDRVDQWPRRGGVGVLDQQQQARRPLRQRSPNQRRGHAGAVGGEAIGQPRAIAEGGARQQDRHRAVKVGGGERELVGPGADVGESGAKPVGKMFQHDGGNAPRADTLPFAATMRHKAASCVQRGTNRTGRDDMAKGQQKKSKETRKPKKEVKKTIAANPSTKGSLKSDD